MHLSDVCLMYVCLYVMYIGPKSRTERPRKTKIGTEVAHVTRDSDTTFKVKRSRSPGRFTHRGLNARGRCSSDHENVLSMGNYCYVASGRRRTRRWGAHGGGEGRGHIVSPHAQFIFYSVSLLLPSYITVFSIYNNYECVCVFVTYNKDYSLTYLNSE